MYTRKVYAILVTYRMGDIMEWVLVTLMWLFSFLALALVLFIIASMVWLVYMVSKLFKEDDPYTFENDGEP